MMYADLTSDEKLQVDAHARELRAICGSLAKLCARVDELQLLWDEQAGLLVNSIDDGAQATAETITDAFPASKETVLALVALVSGLKKAVKNETNVLSPRWTALLAIEEK